MNTTIDLFHFQDFAVETIRDESGDPLFRAKSVCQAIGVNNARQAARRVSPEFREYVILNDAIGRPQKQTFLREAGVWELLGSARVRKDHPGAERIQAFRRWLYAEVLPEIRRTGGYNSAPATASLASHVTELDATLQVAKLYGLEGNQTLLCASNRMRRDFGIDMLATLQLSLPSPQNQAWFTPTQLGDRFAEKKSAQKTNLWLVEQGFQFKDGNKWRLTEAGKAHGEYQDCGKEDGRGTPIQVIRWRESVFENA